MLVWLIAILFTLLGVASGYYKGAIRASFTLLGLLLGAALALPLSGLGASMLSFKWTHPVVGALLGPLPIFFIVLFAFFGLGVWAHQKASYHYKYKVQHDDLRVAWERMNQQLGLCVGGVNGIVSVYLLCTGLYVLGYFTVQISTDDRDPWWAKIVNSISRSIDETGFKSATAFIAPVPKLYFDAADTLGLLYRSPQLQDRLSRYPLFLPIAEEDRFKKLGEDKGFAGFWKGSPSLADILSHPVLGPIVQDIGFYRRMLDLVGPDLADLQTFLETGRSPKFADEPILNRWLFSYPDSYRLAKRIKPNMTIQEQQYLRAVIYQTAWADATLTAYLDNSVLVKNKSKTGQAQSVQGTWKHEYGGKYLVTLREEGDRNDYEALVETNALTLTRQTLALVFGH